ncbi:MAG: TonB-dependent hemoglobin/transferrin/lactoferrin family receptor [Alphaproteobacteria bacterium]|nr:TonB-dependent hemoglobin/transferrin/lactoferrin family receptor [Alphaproteobacteria bacterium]
MLRRLGLLLLFSASIPALTVGLAAGQTAPGTPPANDPPAAAPDAAANPPPRVFDLDATTSTATREERPLVDVPASVTVIDQREIDRRAPHTMRDIVRYEPGVNVGNQPGRAGATNYNIRGIGENRVRIQIDGVRVPDFPGTNIGPGTYTRDFVDLDVVRRLEIVRGPASALYGSDAIGGVVSYVTLDPTDILARTGRNGSVGGRVGWDSSDQSWGEAVYGAGRAGPWEILLTYAHRDGHQVNPNSPSTTIVNPQTYMQDNFLGKLVWNPTAIDRIRLTVENLHRNTYTEIYTDRGVVAGTTVQDSNGIDRNNRFRISLDHVHDGRIGFVDRAEWRLYYTSVNRREITDQLRFASGTQRLRHTELVFDQDIFGGEVQFANRFATGRFAHSLIWGVQADYTLTTRPRSRWERNLATGVVTQTFSGGPGVPAESFPNKNFPDTATTQVGVYVQNEVQVGDFTLLPALRFDYYHMRPSPDADFARTNTSGFQVSTVSATALSPKFGVTWRIAEPWTAFAQYARGFRAPPYDDANIGFTNGPQRYEVLPNPNLNPETSDSFEAGVRLRLGSQLRVSAAGFYNLYHDFIDYVTLGTTPAGITQFQPRNITRATIWGAEARAEWRFAEEWTLAGAMAYANGENNETDAPLDSVAPFMAVLGLSYDHRGGTFGGRINGIVAARHNRTSSAANFQAPSYGIMDVTAYWEPTPNVRLIAGVYNLFDARYFNYLDVVGLAAANTAQRDRLAAPGRTFTAALTLRW